jgi:carbon starvation protein
VLPLLALTFGLLLIVGYRSYGRFVERRLAPDDARVTPAEARADGVDFVPTQRFYLFGQHLSAIAAAGPIAGPILAARDFGWLPCLLWIALGVVLIGAVHDFAALFASVRHGAGSIAEVARANLGTPAGRALMLFIAIALVYVIVAFADITASSFAQGTEELAGVALAFDPGGAVALASVLYLGLALVMGAVQRFLRPPLWLATVVFVPATFAVVWFATEHSTWIQLDQRTFGLLILGYCVLAAITPVWLLLQPRGYLGGFVLFTALFAGLAGLFFGGHAIEQPHFKGWEVAGNSLFPMLFVTIACGACSGFHGLVCSGTTSKQLARESHTRFVGYGAMLAEGLLAFLALATFMIARDADIVNADGSFKAPGTIYGNGLGRFMTLFVGAEHLRFATTFGAMAFSTFVFDTLDVCTRLGRYLVQELCGWRGRAGATLATLLVMTPPAVILARSEPGAYLLYWKLFGASNQLLAALTLFAVGFWLLRARRPCLFVFLPMAFVLVMTSWALVQILLRSAADARESVPALVNALASGALLLLAAFLLWTGLARLRAARAEARDAPG